jgi:dihydrofolate reductase
MHVSLDGFVGGPNGEMDWIQHDDEIFAYVSEYFKGVGTCLYGKTTYNMMKSYWPTVPSNPDSTKLELAHAEWVEKVEKIAFSTSLDRVDWSNTRLIKQTTPEEITKLKQKKGKDMMIFGSPRLTHSFMELGLIDEFLININPVILGNGIPLFKKLKHQSKLQLISSRKFGCGVVGLHYRVLKT